MIADIPQILEIQHQSPTAAHWTADQYERSIRSETESFDRLVLIAQQLPGAQASRIVGFLVARHLAPEWELENIVVSSSEQRRGIGGTLLQTLLQRANEADNGAVFLEVRESNAAARGLYESGGFRQAGRRKSYYANPLEDAVLYRWDPS